MIEHLHFVTFTMTSTKWPHSCSIFKTRNRYQGRNFLTFFFSPGWREWQTNSSALSMTCLGVSGLASTVNASCESWRHVSHKLILDTNAFCLISFPLLATVPSHQSRKRRGVGQKPSLYCKITTRTEFYQLVNWNYKNDKSIL